MRATIKDVAKRAGVSIATVSHVINSTRTVTDETKSRVQEAIDFLGYTPNLRARNFKTGQSGAIGVIIPDISNLFFAAILEEIESAVNPYNYTLMIANTHEDPTREAKALQHFSTGIVDGIILATTYDNYPSLEPLLPRDIPIVFFDRKLDGAPYDTITVANTFSINQALENLVKKGHQKIGCIANLPHISTTKERISAYRSTMTRHKLFYSGRYLRCANHVTDDGYLLTGELLKEGCTALLVLSNIMTRSALQCILNAGMVPGKDIDIIGYYNPDFLMVNMINILPPDRSLGQCAGKMLMSRLQNPKLPVQKTELFSKLQTDC